eukprot:IDg11000t1
MMAEEVVVVDIFCRYADRRPGLILSGASLCEIAAQAKENVKNVAEKNRASTIVSRNIKIRVIVYGSLGNLN